MVGFFVCLVIKLKLLISFFVTVFLFLRDTGKDCILVRFYWIVVVVVEVEFLFIFIFKILYLV